MSCCSDSDHLPNRDDPVAKQQLAEDLRQTAANFRDFLFSSSMRYIRVLEPAAVFRDMVDGEVWGEDAVHPTQWSVPFIKMELGKNLLVYTTFVIKA
jgi:hypothetical protein